MRVFRVLLLLAILSGAADIATTTYGLEHTEAFEEGNGTLIVSMSEYGIIAGHVALKAVALSLFVVLSVPLPETYKGAVMLPPILIWAGAAVWNFSILFF